MKEAIEEKATVLFFQRGFKNVTMDDLAMSMGISKKTLYSHFENKLDLVQRCAQRIFDQACLEIENVKQHAEHPIQELYSVKSLVLKYFANETTSPIYQLQKYYPEVYNHIKNQEYDRMGGLVKSSLEEGMASNLFRDNIDVDFVSRLYLIGTGGLRDIDFFPPSKYQIKQVIENYLEYHLRAIVTPKGLEILNQFIGNTQT